MSQYPRDEFDKVPESSARQGVHRERLIPSRSSGLRLLITVGVLALLIGLAAYFVLPRLGIGTGSAEPSPAAQAAGSPTASPSASPSASQTPTQSADAEPAVESASPSPSADPTSTSSPTEPAVDRTQPVTVLNASGVSGLGAGVSGQISGAGWAVGPVGNWTGAPQQGSGVYYSSPEQAVNAQEVGAQLGIPALESPGFTNVTVVVGPDFR